MSAKKVWLPKAFCPPRQRDPEVFPRAPDCWEVDRRGRSRSRDDPRDTWTKSRTKATEAGGLMLQKHVEFRMACSGQALEHALARLPIPVRGMTRVPALYAPICPTSTADKDGKPAARQCDAINHADLQDVPAGRCGVGAWVKKVGHTTTLVLAHLVRLAGCGRQGLCASNYGRLTATCDYASVSSAILAFSTPDASQI